MSSTPRPPARHPFRVRQQTSGYNGVTSFIVVMLKGGGRSGRVSTEPLSKGQAQAQADGLNIGHLVKPHAEDPRPYAERLAEAEVAYRAEVVR